MNNQTLSDITKVLAMVTDYSAADKLRKTTKNIQIYNQFNRM